jgi:hypothetical protein
MSEVSDLAPISVATNTRACALVNPASSSGDRPGVYDPDFQSIGAWFERIPPKDRANSEDLPNMLSPLAMSKKIILPLLQTSQYWRLSMLNRSKLGSFRMPNSSVADT